jgi:hypothetical protein
VKHDLYRQLLKDNYIDERIPYEEFKHFKDRANQAPFVTTGGNIYIKITYNALRGYFTYLFEASGGTTTNVHSQLEYDVVTFKVI